VTRNLTTEYATTLEYGIGPEPMSTITTTIENHGGTITELGQMTVTNGDIVTEPSGQTSFSYSITGNEKKGDVIGIVITAKGQFASQIPDYFVLENNLDTGEITIQQVRSSLHQVMDSAERTQQ